MVVENLLQFGLNEKEISVYLGLVYLGPAPAREIARQAKVNRGTTYDILKSLVDLGLVAFYKQADHEDKRQYFVAEPPQKILTAVENRKRNLDVLKDQLRKSLPELESLYEKSGARPVVKYYEGSNGIRTILQDVISTVKDQDKKEYYVYSSADIRKYLYKAYPDYNEDRLKSKVAVKVIALGEGGELAGLDERKWLTQTDTSPTYILIYSGKMAMITLDAIGNCVGVIIENEGLYQTQVMIFNKLWSTL